MRPADALGLIGLILAFRVTMGRAKHKVTMGDGGNPDVIVRMGTHANFVESVPLMLVLPGLLELGGANRTALMVGAAALVVATNQAVLAFAPVVLGAVRDIASGYVWSFALAVAIQFGSAGIILIRRP